MERLINAQNQFDDFGIRYIAMIESANLEMSSMVKNYNAQIISRIGNVVEQMKDIQINVENHIQERAIVINSTTAQCLIDTKLELDSAVEEAGLVFVQVTTEIIYNFNELSTTLVYPLFEEISVFITNFEYEFLRTFATVNAVTNIEEAVNLLLFEAIHYDILFETYVYCIIKEFSEWLLQTNQQNAGLFQIMQGSLDYFRFNSELIKNTLQDCNSDEIE